MKKRDPDKNDKGKELEGLSVEESDELEMIWDRLQVQAPEGQSLPNCLQSLNAALVSREALATALIEKIGKDPSDVGFKVFLRLKDLFPSKSYKRLVKQIAYRLSQKGFGAETGEASDTRVVLVQREEKRAVAHIVPGNDDSFGVIVVLAPPAGLVASRVICAYVDGPLRLSEVQTVEGTQRNYKEVLQKTSDLFSRKPYEVPARHAAALFFEALDNGGKNGGVRGDIEIAKRLLEPLCEPGRLSYAYDVMEPLDDPKAMEREDHVTRLFENVPVRGLLFPERASRPFFEKLLAMEHSTIVVPKEIQEERALGLLEEAADHLCQGETREGVARFFEETALRFKLGGEEELALSAWIVASILRSEGPASRSLFITRLCGLGFQYYWPETFAPAPVEKEPKAGDAAPLKRTESGLILL